MRRCRFLLILITASTAICAEVGAAQRIVCPPAHVLIPLFKDARRIDLRTCKAASVVKLRDELKIPTPETIVLVMTYSRKSLPTELRPIFDSANASGESMSGVTMNGCYIVVIRSGFAKEDSDVLNHELVHAYISLASPEPLPFWFQEASAVHFSTDSARRVYGKASEERPGETEARVVEITEQYQQKLQSFHYLIERVGKKKFYAWYAHAVEAGVVDTRPLLGLTSDRPPVRDESGMPLLIGIIIAAMLVFLSLIIRGLISARSEKDSY